MSFTEAKRMAIQNYMLDKIRSQEKDFLKKTAENFGISETSVRRYINDCLRNGILMKEEETPTGWQLKTVLLLSLKTGR